MDVLFPGVEARVVYTILFRVDASSVDVLLPRVDARVVDMLLRRVDVSPVDVLSHGGDEHVISIMNFTLKFISAGVVVTFRTVGPLPT